jgi:septum formation protein
MKAIDSIAFFVSARMKFPKLILASSSPRRKLLLRQVGLRFTIKPSLHKERFRKEQSPSQNVRRIALEKADTIARAQRHGIVVAADTIVVLGRTILGKPKSKHDARRMLSLLSGKSHKVYTGFALIDTSTGRRHAETVKTDVRFRQLSEDEIRAYVESGIPMDKAGAYGIQDDFGAVFVEKVNGCFYNVVGLPLARFYVVLKQFVNKNGSRKQPKR